MSDVEKVGAKSLCYGIFSLSYILLLAGFAGDTVHLVRTLVGDIVFAGVNGGGAFESFLEFEERQNWDFWWCIISLRIWKRKSWTVNRGLVSPNTGSNQ